MFFATSSLSSDSFISANSVSLFRSINAFIDFEFKRFTVLQKENDIISAVSFDDFLRYHSRYLWFGSEEKLPRLVPKEELLEVALAKGLI